MNNRNSTGNTQAKAEVCPPDCGKVINPRTLTESNNVPAKPFLTVGHVITKIPVVLAERTVQIDIESAITLDRPAIEIKRIRKELFLTQCRLLPRAGKLFLKGFIRKNIEFATGECIGDTTVSGDIRHTTVNVPFESVTKIPFVLGAKPITVPNKKAREFQTFDPKVMGADPNEIDAESTQFFNERIFCELVKAKFIEADIQTDRCEIAGAYHTEGTFTTITEKLVVLITFKLLQMQQVMVKGHHMCFEEYDEDKVEMEVDMDVD